MKRTWESSAVAYSEPAPQQVAASDEAVWVQMPSHPYAAAYSNMANPFTPSPLHTSTTYGGTGEDRQEKKPRVDGGQSKDGEGDSEMEGDEDDEEDEDEELGGRGASGKSREQLNVKPAKGQDGKRKQKLTRGSSKACTACDTDKGSCRKIKMRCIPSDSSAGQGLGICKASCHSTGGHECVFEESNRGKRSTRKNEALAAKLSKMENALKNIGAALSNIDPTSLRSFSSALHSFTNDPEIIGLITSHASEDAAPAITVGTGSRYHRDFTGERGHQPPLSPRLHSLPDNVLSPLGLLAEASLQNDTSKRTGKTITSRSGKNIPRPLSAERMRAQRNGATISLNGTQTFRMATSDIRGHPESAEHGLGVSSQNYFKPNGNISFLSNMPADNRIPELLTIVTREEIGELFDIFFDNMWYHVPLVYREFHTPDLVLQRSQFLCTVICAIAARFYHHKPEIHHQLSTYAKRLAFEVPSRGYKSVEVVQAYLLLSLWTLGPEKTFEQDRTWLMLGMAIRMATDLNLHRKSIMSNLDTEEGRARDLEIINRERCWLHCFVLDRSLSAQMGKPYSLREDYIIRSSCEPAWYQQKFSLPSDRNLSAYVALQQIMSRAIDSIYSSTTTISGLRHDCDYMLIVRSAHEELRRWSIDSQNMRRVKKLLCRASFYFAYSTLVLYSFGLENAIERARMDISFFLTNVYEAATKVCMVVKEEFLPKGWLPYLPDTNFVMCSYALLSLLKLLKPELRSYHDSEEAIFKLVSEVADILEDCAVGPSHQPAIYSAFIREIVRKTKEIRHGTVTAPTSPGGHTTANLMHGIGTDQSISVNLVDDTASGAASAASTRTNAMDGEASNEAFDPSLINHHTNWHPDVLPHETQFTFIPPGGDMLILPSQAGPSMAPSPTSTFLTNPTSGSGAGGQHNQGHGGNSSIDGWPEYLPTFMSSDGFDGWDGSMLLPGFGRGQITLSGGLLHSQYGSGIITPAHQTPVQSRVGSRAASRAQSPHPHHERSHSQN
nr:hypothetical protein L203_00851 [Cryptococcus depauperatus CBS 7841]